MYFCPVCDGQIKCSRKIWLVNDPWIMNRTSTWIWSLTLDLWVDERTCLNLRRSRHCKFKIRQQRLLKLSEIIITFHIPQKHRRVLVNLKAANVANENIWERSPWATQRVGCGERRLSSFQIRMRSHRKRFHYVCVNYGPMWNCKS